MTLRRHISYTASVCALLLSACGPGFTDKDNSPAAALKIEVPESAKPLGGYLDPYRVEFLMPNDQWRSYVDKYYPGKTLSEFTSKTEYEYPSVCIAAFRSGVHLVKWVTSDEIQYLDTDQTAHRSVSAIPDCEQGKAYVRWSLDKPK
ncbi:Uncharacterised protein [Mycobacteroides abscessus subsp. abscessus]|nr:Uncharacterised protein [Mycobacteroides abscessus subsp. abscessus]